MTDPIRAFRASQDSATKWPRILAPRPPLPSRDAYREAGNPALILPVWRGQVALGNGTQFMFLLTWVPGGDMFVGVEGFGCYTFGGWTSAGYVEEKLKVLPGDAGNIADFINAQLGHQGRLQGRYNPDMTVDAEPAAK